MKEPSLQASYLWGEYWRERGINPPKYQSGENVFLRGGNHLNKQESQLTVKSSFPGSNGNWWYILTLHNRIEGLRFPEQELIGVNE